MVIHGFGYTRLYNTVMLQPVEFGCYDIGWQMGRRSQGQSIFSSTENSGEDEENNSYHRTKESKDKFKPSLPNGITQKLLNRSGGEPAHNVVCPLVIELREHCHSRIEKRLLRQ